MKRNLMLAVLLVSIVFAGHLGVTRASKHGPGPRAEGHHVRALTAPALAHYSSASEEFQRGR